MKYLLIASLLLSGCSLSADQIHTIRKQCTEVGMEVRWFVEGLTNKIIDGQCDPVRKVSK